MNKVCLDCNINITPYRNHIRCKSCNMKFQWKNKIRLQKHTYIVSKSFLVKEYIDRKHSSEYIAQKLGCHKTTILRNLKKYNIKKRTNKESHVGQKVSEELKKKYSKMFKGSGNPNWKNGLGNYPYNKDFNKHLKYKIRKRDNFICKNCGIKEKHHFRGNKLINLIVHHIDYNKNNCKSNNLITVCNKCNIIANSNRDYWYAFYTYLMEVK